MWMCDAQVLVVLNCVALWRKKTKGTNAHMMLSQTFDYPLEVSTAATAVGHNFSSTSGITSVLKERLQSFNYSSGPGAYFPLMVVGVSAHCVEI